MPAPVKQYVSLTNLSIGRPATGKDGDRQADIVHKGETVSLTDEQAHGFLTRHRVPVIRPVSDKAEPDPGLKARDLFGRQPGASQFGARPDPAGASRVIEVPEAEDARDPEHARNAPEASDPQPDLSVDPDAAKDKGTGVKAK